MKLDIIVAASENRVIGKDNKMPWHLPADLKLFKVNTLGHNIVMGRNTFESIGKPLPGRKNIVLSRNINYNPEGVINLHSWEEVFNEIKEEKTFLIGGGQLYLEALERNFIHKILLSKIHAIFDGDVFFPDPLNYKFTKSAEILYEKDEKNIYDFTLEVWIK